MIRLHALLVIVCCAAATLWSQQPDAQQPPRLRFLFIDETPGAYSLTLGKEQRQISANPYEISAVVVPADLKPLGVYKTFPADPDPATSRPKRLKIASVTVPARMISALVVITPRPAEAPDVTPVYQVEIIDSSPEAFPAGSLRIINRSPVTMAAQFGTEKVVTTSGGVSLLQPVPDARHRILFKIAIQVQRSSGWELIQDSMTVIRPAERMTGILVYSPGGMKHMLTAAELAEFGPPKPGCFWLTFSDTP
jgi:hypothetical protein